MLKRILVPLDGSPLAERALDVARDIARAAGARINLVMVRETGTIGASTGSPPPSENVAQLYLRYHAERLAGDGRISVGSVVAQGDAIDQICVEAQRLTCDLIVMTTHGRTGFSRAWIGSVADGVVRGSAVPVLLLRGSDAETPVAATSPMQHMLIALDGSPQAEAILGPACTVARLTGAAITLLRVVEPVPILAVDAVMPYVIPIPVIDEALTATLREGSEGYLEEVAARLAPLSVSTKVVVSDHPAGAILRMIVDANIDIVALTTHGRDASRLIIGSVADKILRATTRSLLLYRPMRQGAGRAIHDRRTRKARVSTAV